MASPFSEAVNWAGAPSSPTPTASVAASTTSRTFYVMLAIIIILIMVICVLIYLLLRGKPTEKATVEAPLSIQMAAVPTF